MATSTFDRKIELTDVESVKKLLKVMNEDVSKKPLSKHPYTDKEREQSEWLIKQLLSRSRR